VADRPATFRGIGATMVGVYRQNTAGRTSTGESCARCGTGLCDSRPTRLVRFCRDCRESDPEMTSQWYKESRAERERREQRRNRG
jgi:hypothetical protein